MLLFRKVFTTLQWVHIKLVLSLNARIRIKYIYFSKRSRGSLVLLETNLKWNHASGIYTHVNGSQVVKLFRTKGIRTFEYLGTHPGQRYELHWK